MTGITSSAKISEHEKFCDNIKIFSGAICNLIEASAQSAYLVRSQLSNIYQNTHFPLLYY